MRFKGHITGGQSRFQARGHPIGGERSEPLKSRIIEGSKAVKKGSLRGF